MNSKDSALVPIEEKEVDFYGDLLTAALIQVPDEDEPVVYVPVRPMCEYMGLSFAGQRERINRDPVLSESVRFIRVSRTNSAGGNPNLLAIPLKFIPGWLFGISVSRVRPELQDKIKSYQRECFDVLWEAFQTGRLTRAGRLAHGRDLMQGEGPAVQAYHLAVAVADLARNQVLMEERLGDKLDDHGRRIEEIEAVLGDPGRHVTPDQAGQISQAVKAVALALGKKTGRNEYGGVYGELYRRFAVTSYKQLPATKFEKAMKWLAEWHQELTGDVPF